MPIWEYVKPEELFPLPKKLGGISKRATLSSRPPRLAVGPEPREVERSAVHFAPKQLSMREQGLLPSKPIRSCNQSPAIRRLRSTMSAIGCNNQLRLRPS